MQLCCPLGEPIPRRLAPPPDAIEYYTDAKNRGYLADPEEIARERVILAQKYGYELSDINNDPMVSEPLWPFSLELPNLFIPLQSHVLKANKDPRQVFYGLKPGWVVNLKDRKIYEPLREDLKEYYAS